MDNNGKVLDMDQYLLDKSKEALDGIGETIDRAAEVMTEEDFKKFAEHTMKELERVRKILNE